jgi:hypothetical protein
MKATKAEIERLLASHGIAPLLVSGSDSAKAAQGGRIAQLRIEQDEDRPSLLTIAIAGHSAQSPVPHDLGDARAVVASLRAQGALPSDSSFEHMLADLLLKASRLFEDSEASRLAFSRVHLHPSSYHVEEVELIHEKPLHTEARLAPDSHDRRAVFDHRHGDSTEFPK